jgi:hypothetical protein
MSKIDKAKAELERELCTIAPWVEAERVMLAIEKLIVAYLETPAIDLKRNKGG